MELHDPHLWISAEVDPGLEREVQGGGPFSPIFFLWGWGAMEALFVLACLAARDFAWNVLPFLWVGGWNVPIAKCALLLQVWEF